ncbi:MAG: DNA polymerase III subunit gamma/tau [Clostridia bacterium]|nr:DNA polymerase III subunit gamma/tau [Clostridia bacterium]
MYLSLYRKWRPRTFDEMCGQQHITEILKKQCAEGRVSHAYLFCGTRGTGKTSAAKILAKAVNCEHPKDGNPCNECASCRSIDNGSATDVLEIDAASNNRVDNVRDLRDEVVYPPSVLKKRVYIIDEVHMLTDSAFNALLKTLEEPPEYVVFVLATTELNELPPTIISRCIRFDFSRIDPEAVKARIDLVAAKEGIRIEDSAAELISELADGSMRDGLSLLEAVSNGTDGTITRETVQGVFGIAGDETIRAMLHSIAAGDIPAAVSTIAEVHRSSKDISVFIDDLSVVVRDLIIEKQLGKYGGQGKLRKTFLPLADEFTAEKLFYVSSVLEDTQSRISRYSMNKRVVFELAVIRMCDPSLSDSPKALAARIAELEKKISVMSVMGAGTDATSVIKEEPKPRSAPESPKEEPVKDPEPEEEPQIPFNRFEEINEFLNDSPSMCAFLGSTDIMLQGAKVIITGDKFTIDMIAMDNDFPLLTAAFSSVLGRKAEVVLKTADKKEEEAQQSLIDELL